ncbi:MAG: hypothetical protein CVV49_00355 [Spirochaetae bacterium HGW-Spirochaetae-5]|nr:MAG: hypothetical protein CVV49_00355 [Spirochaetae bacterium HGW-Spirochaetae-5]
MPVFNSSIEKLFLGKMNFGPAPILDLLGGFSFYAVTSAVELKLFEILNVKEMSSIEIAQAVDCDARGLDTLLELLETLGYLKNKKNMYSLTRMTRKWMLPSSSVNFSDGFLYYSKTMVDCWPYITASMKKGDAHIYFYEWLKDKPDTAASFQKFMMSLALLMIPELLKKIKLTNESILDIGGSHGLYSIALCRSNPDITVTIIDSEYAMPLLRNNIKEAGMEHRIKLITGDFMENSSKIKYDRILLFNVLHEHKEAYNIELLSRIRGTLNSKGSLIILDGMREKKISRLADLATRMYSLMFFHFLGGQNYSFKEISMWLKSAGFSQIKRKELYKSGFSLIIGE